MEQRPKRRAAVVATGVLSGLLGCPWLFAQQSTGRPEGEPQKDAVPSMEKSPQEELKELFSKVDLRLERVTKLLFQASSRDADAATEIGAAGISELIHGAEAQSSNALGDIAKLLEATQRQGDALLLEIDRMIEIAGMPST